MAELKKRLRRMDSADHIRPGQFVKLKVETEIWVRVTSRFPNGNFKGAVVKDASLNVPVEGGKVRFGKCHIHETVEE